MPLTDKGEEIKANMEKEYGAKKGESVFYASKNAGTISGVDARVRTYLDSVRRGDGNAARNFHRDDKR